MNIADEINKAINFAKNKEFKKAEGIYKTVLNKEPKNQTALSCLGWMYYTCGNYKKAEKIVEKAYNIKPSSALVECLAVIKYSLNKYDEALCYFNLIEDDKKSQILLEKNISALISAKMYQQSYDLALLFNAKYPFLKESTYFLALTSIFAGKLDNLQKLASNLVKFFPDYYGTWYINGIMNEMLFQNDKLAFECFKKQLKFGDGYSAYMNLIISSARQNMYDKALYYLKQFEKNYPLDSEYYFIKASVYFKKRKFKKAYKYYINKHDVKSSNSPYSMLKRLWNGKCYRNQTLLVYCDQGAGDCIMFSRYFPQLETKFKKVIIAAREDLIPLLERSIVSKANFEYIPFTSAFNVKYNKSVEMSNIPYYLNSDLKDIPYSNGYFCADSEKVQYYKDKYFNNKKLKVGICWEAGGAAWREQLSRTLHISLFEDILKMNEIEFYSLQHEPMFDYYKNYNIVDLKSELTDFDETAAILKNLDIVISVDTSVAHLAGALGVPTYLLLPYFTDWRWFDDTKVTPWYDSVKIFKQIKRQSWDNEILDIKNSLSDLLNKNK